MTEPARAYTSQTILFGEYGTAKLSAECVRFISRSVPGKAVMEVKFAGRRSLAKCWDNDLYKSYEAERDAYDAFYDLQPAGYSFFPSLLAYGEIVCSSLIPTGHILILSWVVGEQVSILWPSPTDMERAQLFEQCRQAVAVLRQLGIYMQDSGRHNVLFNRSSGRVALVDFEHYGGCTEHLLHNLEAPEILTIFGRSGLMNITNG